MKHSLYLSRRAYLVASLLLLAVLLSGCGTAVKADTIAAQSTEAPAFVDIVWEWQGTQGGDDSVLEIDDPSRYTVQFGADGTASIQADCNRVSWTYTASDSSLTFDTLGPSTLAACPPDSLADQFLAQLGATASYVLEEDTLFLNMMMDGGDMIFAPQAAAAPEFTEVVWEWQGTQGGDDSVLEIDDPSRYTIQFGADGTASIQADCNMVSWTYTVSDSSLSFDTLGPSTLAACPPDSLADQFLAQLGATASYMLEEDTLFLNMMMDGGDMIFAPQDTGTEAGGDVTGVGAADGILATFHALLPSEDSPGRYLTLTGFEDGTFTLTIDFLNDEPPREENGTWEQSEDGLITLTVLEQDNATLDEPVTIKLRREGNDLIAEEYDVTLYGEEGLPLSQRIAAAKPLREARRAFLTLDLEAGFPLDPFFVSVNGGGEMEASLLAEGCLGYIHHEPVLSVDWEGETDFVEVFFYSDHDPTLVIQTPDGEYLCSDDANAILHDPVIELANPVKGVYNIWVGSYHAHQLLPGVLVLTTRPDVNVGTFSLQGLIQRPSIPEVLDTPEGQAAQEAVRAAIDRYDGRVGKLSPSNNRASVNVRSAGDIAAFELPFVGDRCNGFIADTPSYLFDWSGAAANLAIFFESNNDASLMVLTPDQRVLCNDDAETGANLNPLVLIENPAKGRYAVFVGRINPETRIRGALTVTSVADAQPTALAPEAP